MYSVGRKEGRKEEQREKRKNGIQEGRKEEVGEIEKTVGNSSRERRRDRHSSLWFDAVSAKEETISIWLESRDDLSYSWEHSELENTDGEVLKGKGPADYDSVNADLKTLHWQEISGSITYGLILTH